MREIFGRIYNRNEWLYGSGEGSLPKHTKGYVAVLQNFFSEFHIESVVDMGCGDWQFSQFIDWNGIYYQGYDIVKSVIDCNKEKYSSNNIEFHLYSGIGNELPDADLLIAKDVLQHWSYKSIENFLPNLSRYKYCLITNCVNPIGETINYDIEDGEFRYLDLRLPPFNIDAQDIFSFTNKKQKLFSLFVKTRWLKKVLLVTQNNYLQFFA